MPTLKPLGEWICDSCGATMTLDKGWLEWLSPQRQAAGPGTGPGPHSFRIVHNKRACYHHDAHPDRSDMHLSAFVGADGLQQFLSMLDLGPVLDPSAKHTPSLSEMTSFTDTVRRLHIPYYEEARRYFADAVEDGYFGDNNEVAIHLPTTCEAIIARYEKP